MQLLDNSTTARSRVTPKIWHICLFVCQWQWLWGSKTKHELTKLGKGCCSHQALVRLVGICKQLLIVLCTSCAVLCGKILSGWVGNLTMRLCQETAVTPHFSVLRLWTVPTLPAESTGTPADAPHHHFPVSFSPVLLRQDPQTSQGMSLLSLNSSNSYVLSSNRIFLPQ